MLCRAQRVSSFPLRPVRYIGHPSSLRRAHTRGQNLSTRYQRLEKSLREKEGLAQNIEHLVKYPNVGGTVTNTPQKRVEIFHGFEIPKEPRPPQDDECCMSNCAVCVYDLYEESLNEYRKSIADLRTTLSTRNIPEEEWPQNVRSATTLTTSGDRKKAVLNAFEELEQALAKKHRAAEANISAGH
ncbi:hypothetical protein J132_08041 [Termitomyces sp. J132]|nr:hypothetical protein J132_08041 [Termitomyces sp. J132]